MKGNKLRYTRKAVGILFAALLGSAFLLPLVTAGAVVSEDPSVGAIEICKTFTTPPITVGLTPTFSYTISGVEGTINVTAGTCSAPILASGGSHTVTEAAAQWYSVTSIVADAGYPALGTTSLTAQTAVLNVNGEVSEVHFTNALDPGYVEVCKAATTGSGLTGTFSFNITGADSFSTSTTVPVGACSDPIEVPAGTVTTTEAGTNLYVTSISAVQNGTGPNELTGTPDLTTGTATSTVARSANSSVQTDINYTNDVVNLKVCKVWSNANGPETLLAGGTSTEFPFTETATGVAGPNTAPASFSLLSGECSDPTPYRAGTVVSVTEGIVAGSKVQAIVGDGGDSVVPNSISLTGRTISVIVGTPVTASINPINETVVAFANEYADPGTLKICKAAGTPAPIGTNFSFTTSGVGAVGGGTVPVGSCAFVLNSTGGILQIPFNTNVTVTEGASAGNATSAISVVPTFVSEVVGSTLTVTAEPAEASPATLGGTGTTSSVVVTTGETTTTEVTFTDIDPPATMTILPAPVVIDIPSPTGNGGTTTILQVSSPSVNPTSVGTSIAAGIPGVVTNSPTVLTLKLSPQQVRALLKLDEKNLSNVKSSITKDEAVLKHLSGRQHKAELVKINNLKARERTLELAIKALK